MEADASRTYIQCAQEKPIPSAVLRVLKNILEESGWVTGGFRATFPGDENVKKLTAVIAACIFEYTKKNHKNPTTKHPPQNCTLEMGKLNGM